MNHIYLIMTAVMYLIATNVLAGMAKISPQKITDSIVIDGKMDERSWENASQYRLQYAIDGEPAKSETHFRVLYDEYAIYIGILCHETDMKALRNVVKKHDGGVWQDDSVEIFLNPSHKNNSYAHFIINSSGVVYDEASYGGRILSWDAVDIETATYKSNQFWSLEVKIPIAALYGIYEDDGQREKISGATWSMNIGRNRYAGGSWEISTFARLTSFRDTSRYMELENLTYERNKFFWNIYDFTVTRATSQATGYRVETRVALENKTGKLRMVVFSSGIEKMPDSLKSKKIGIDNRQMYQEKGEWNLAVAGDYSFVGILRDTRGNLLAARNFWANVSHEPLSLEIIEPYYRNAIYATMDVKMLRLRLIPKIELPSGALCRIYIKSADNLIIAEKHFNISEIAGQDIEFPVPFLSSGKWSCVAEIDSENLRAENTLHVYPPTTTEIRVNKNNNLVLNGKEKMPIGSIHNYWSYKEIKGSEEIDFCLSYSPAYNLVDDPQRRASLMADAKAGRYWMFYPETKELWSHISSLQRHLALKPLSEENAKKIALAVRQYNEIPSIFGWYLADEPIPARHLPRYLEQLANVVRTNDPYRPCFISFNNGNSVKTYEKAFDLCGMHLFPGYHTKGTSEALTAFGENIKLAVQGTGNRKPVYAGIPLTPYSPGGISRMPTYLENRCLVYLGIVNGAKGIFWNTAADIVADIENRLGIPALTHELRALEPIVLSSDLVEIAVNGEVQSLAKIVNGHLYLVTVNPHNREISAVLEVPEQWRSLYSLDSERQIILKDKFLNLTYRPYEVRLFSSNPQPLEFETQEKLRKRFIDTEKQFVKSGNLLYYSLGTKIHYSDHFSNITPELDKVLIDGYKELYPRFKRKMGGEGWIELTMGQPQSISRVEISWQSRKAMPISNAKLEINGNIIVEHHDINSHDNEIYTSVYRFDPMETDKVKIIITGGLGSLLPTEIQAYKN